MVRRGRWLTVLAVCVIPCAIAAGWAGCATADDEVSAVPKKNPGGGDTAAGGDGEDLEDGGDDDGGGSGDGGKGPDGGEGGGAGAQCTDATMANTCATATDLGKIPVGFKRTVTASVPPTGGDLWFKITYESLDDRAAHPRVLITPSSTPLAFQVVKNCAAEEFTCGDEPGTKSSKLKDFEFQYRPEGGVVDARSDGPATDAAKDTSVTDTGTTPPLGDAGGGDAPDTFIPFKLGTGGVIYVRVFRPAGASPGCDFKLEVSN